MDTENPNELLAMYRLIQAAKEAAERFEQGEINVREAVCLIRDATAHVRAA